MGRYNALDIANFIICKAKEKRMEITHLKLQKLLYYVVAEYIKLPKGEYLINEPIYKWQYGPVVASVYHEFKTHGNSPITEPIRYLPNDYDITNKESINFIEPYIKNEELKVNKELEFAVNHVLKKLGKEDAFILVDRTHKEQAWHNNSDEYSAEDLLHWTKKVL